MSRTPILVVPVSPLRLTGLGYPEEALSRGARALLCALELLESRAGFHFSAGHQVVFDALLRSRPDLRPRIREAVRVGGMDAGAGWVCLDQSLTTGEVLVRNLAVGLRYAESELGVGALTCHEDISGGLTPQLPQVVEACGLTGIACVGQSPLGPGVYRWEGLDGTAMPVWQAGETGRQLRVVCQPGPGENARTAKTELEPGDSGSPFGLGDALWIPTEVALDSLGEWAEESNLDLGVVTVGEVIQEAGTREALDPVKGEVPGTGPPWDALAPELGEVRCSVSTLLQLEQANAWADLVGLETSGQKALGPRWLTLLSAASTYGSGAGEPEALAGISDVARGVRAACESDLTCVCQALSECVTAAYGPSGSIPVVVYNTLSWNRSGPVRVHATLYGDAVATDSSRYETYRLEDDEGRPVTSQELTGRHTNASEVDLLFVASDVPGGGYRTYYLVPKAPASDPFVGIQAPGSAAPEFPEPAFVVEDVTDQVSRPYRGVRTGRRFRSRYHDLDVNEVTGRVSIADRHLDRDLLRDIRLVAVEESMDAGPAGHSPTGRTHELVPERIELEESGEVRAVLAVSGRLLSSLATIRYRFYEQVPWVDVILNLKWVDEVPARVQMMFPVCATAPQVHYGVPYGHVGLESWAASDEIQGGDGDAAAYHGGNCEGWVAADSDGWGVVLATDRRTFGLAGSVLRNEVLLSCPDPASFGYKRIWRTYPETVTGCFRIRGYDRGFAEGLAHRDGWECTHGMRTSCSYGPSDGRRLPARQSLLRLDAPGLVTSALKQAEDGEALVLRVFETLGKDTVAKLTSLRPILSVSEADMLERAGADQDPVRIPFRPFEIKTLRIQLGAAE